MNAVPNQKTAAFIRGLYKKKTIPRYHSPIQTSLGNLFSRMKMFLSLKWSYFAAFSSEFSHVEAKKFAGITRPTFLWNLNMFLF